MQERCRHFASLPAFLRAARDVVRRKRLCEPIPPTARLLGFAFASFASASCAAFFLQACVVFGCNAGLFGGRSNKEVSGRHKTLVTPAGWAFSIWGVIYLGELAAVGFIWLTPAAHVFADFSAPWLVGNALQALWALAFAQELLGASALLLTGIAAAMCRCALVLTSGDADDFGRAVVALPVALHAGWVCAAALVGWNVAGVARGMSSSSQIALAFFSLHAALALALGSLAAPLWGAQGPGPRAVFALAIAWALFAISKEVDAPGAIASEGPVRRALARTAGLSAALVVGASLCLGVLTACDASPQPLPDAPT